MDKVFQKFLRSGIDPVSYTHLDVYKRQAYGHCRNLSNNAAPVTGSAGANL